jgi:hypothetical protein
MRTGHWQGGVIRLWMANSYSDLSGQAPFSGQTARPGSSDATAASVLTAWHTPAGGIRARSMSAAGCVERAAGYLPTTRWYRGGAS